MNTERQDFGYKKISVENSIMAELRVFAEQNVPRQSAEKIYSATLSYQPDDLFNHSYFHVTEGILPIGKELLRAEHEQRDPSLPNEAAQLGVLELKMIREFTYNHLHRQAIEDRKVYPTQSKNVLDEIIYDMAA